MKVLIGGFLCVLIFGSFGYVAWKETQPNPAPAPATAEQLKVAQGCKDTLSKNVLIKTFAWSNHQAKVEVTGKFNASDDHMILTLNQLVRCAATDGRMDGSLQAINYYDARSKERVAWWKY